MLTVMDQVSPWLTPNKRSATMGNKGAGRPKSQPMQAVHIEPTIPSWRRGATLINPRCQ